MSADDVVNSDYIVFIQDAAWDYHDTDADSKRLKHRDSSDLSREEWISRQEASLLRSGFKEESARRISERFYDLHLRRNDPIELCVQNLDGS